MEVYSVELRNTLIKHIPAMMEDGALLYGHVLKAMTLAEVEKLLVQRQQIHSYLALTLRDFTELRDTLNRTFGEGLERDRVIPLLFELVSEMQEMEDMVRWDVLEGGETYSAEEFLEKSSQLTLTLVALANEAGQLYQERLYQALDDELTSRNAIITLLLLLTTLALILAATIVRHIVSGIEQTVERITELGEGRYDRVVSRYARSYNRSREMNTILDAIERTRKSLQMSTLLEEQAREEVEAQKNFMKDLTDNMHNGVYALDHNGLLQFINPAAEEILGYRSEELMGKNIHEVIHSHLSDGTFVPTGD